MRAVNGACYALGMITHGLSEALALAATWPESAQEELASIAAGIDAALRGQMYEPSPEELIHIDIGVRDADEGRFASPDAVAAMLARHRPA